MTSNNTTTTDPNCDDAIERGHRTAPPAQLIPGDDAAPEGVSGTGVVQTLTTQAPAPIGAAVPAATSGNPDRGSGAPAPAVPLSVRLLAAARTVDAAIAAGLSEPESVEVTAHGATARLSMVGVLEWGARLLASRSVTTFAESGFVRVSGYVGDVDPMWWTLTTGEPIPDDPRPWTATSGPLADGPEHAPEPTAVADPEAVPDVADPADDAAPAPADGADPVLAGTRPPAPAATS